MKVSLLIETDNSPTFPTKIWKCSKTNVIHINDELTELAAKLHLSDEHMKVIVRQYAFYIARKAVVALLYCMAVIICSVFKALCWCKAVYCYGYVEGILR